jgi:hypothetical protein
MAATVQQYLNARAASPALPRNAMMNVLGQIAAFKQRAVAIMDDARDTQLNDPNPGHKQQMNAEIQAWNSEVHQLENISRDLSAAIGAFDDILAIEAAIQASLPPP